MIRRFEAALAPWRAYTRPQFEGLDRIPDARPLLFVCNHTLLRILDVPLLFTTLYRERGIFLRTLGDHIHFKTPLWGRFLRRWGAVDGTRANCAALMNAGECLMVFPGGRREVYRKKNDRYRLRWEGRLGFAKMAIEHQCQIVPVSAVGVEDALDILIDSPTLLNSPPGRVARRLGLSPTLFYPVVRGVGPTPFPRRVPFDFLIGDPISPTPFAHQHDDPDACAALRDVTQNAVEAGIDALLLRRGAPPRAQDPKI